MLPVPATLLLDSGMMPSKRDDMRCALLSVPAALAPEAVALLPVQAALLFESDMIMGMMGENGMECEDELEAAGGVCARARHGKGRSA